MSKYAILLSGGINSSYNYLRYRNDLYLVYTVLKGVGGFADKNIFLFYGNGTGDFRNIGIVPQPAGEKQVKECLEKLECGLVEEDELIFVVSNHGGDEEGGNICLWGREYITLSWLSECLNKIRAKKIIILGECFGGNILKHHIANSCIFTANEQNKPSYAALRNNYDEFLYHFFSYILGMYPDTKNRIPQGGNDLIDAYNYVRRQDVYCPDNTRRIRIEIDGNEVTEIPQMKNSLAGQKLRF